MRSAFTSLATMLLGLACPGLAAPGEDPRMQTLAYSQGLIHLATSPETTQTVLFAPGERIQSVIVSNPGAYQIAVAGSGDALSLKANGGSALAVLSIRTSQRSYELELAPGTAIQVPSVIRFEYTAAVRSPIKRAAPIVQARGFAWQVSGNKLLRPLTVRDDGGHVFIEWTKEQAMPAVFAIGPGGVEEMVEGYVRGGLFTIDRLHSELIFRIDKERAVARRVARKERNG